ncbi:Protein IQ-DOMAIN 31 -like protein [Gossypium arboreum]|uniref:Protein IQ-DOMAIN 31-like protein n=1 Tax=Gossypium arboreum TaxID=29729 RepID=A0A0B0MWY3_GOSAR|nr:Protein IQ-DOMAIN 31 -like protein [Gossypium arboreum]
MDKASKWFRSILGLKRRDSHKQPPSSKRRWSFVKSYREKDSSAVSTATSSLRGLQQPLEDSWMIITTMPLLWLPLLPPLPKQPLRPRPPTGSSGRCARDPVAHVSNSYWAGKELAAVKIQSTFRGYLARRALRALKGLVKLQALVRGHIERKKTAEWLRRMQVFLQTQARARAGRAQISESSRISSKSSHYLHPGPPTPENFEHAVQPKSTKYEQSSMLKRNGSRLSGRTRDNYEQMHPGWYTSDHWIDDQSWDQRGHSTRIGHTDDEKNDKILEVDIGKPRFTSKRRNLFHSTHLALNSDLYGCSFTNSRDSHQTAPTPLSEVQSLNLLKFPHEVEESPFCTADNSPDFHSASSKGGSSMRSPFTPAKSDGSRSYLSGYSDHPNYMAFTESSRAKVRSLSAPKQRPQHDRSSSIKRYSIHGFGELKSGTLKSALHANFANKAYPGSGRLDRLGMPVGYRYY